MSDAIDLRQFRYFVAVCEERNIGRAAARLHISQPPLSRQIQQLERQLGVTLLERGKTGVTLTRAGAALLPEARRTLAQAQKAIAAARALRDTAAGVFTIGYTTVFDRSAIPDVGAALRQRFPDWRIVSEGKHSISLVRDIQNGVMDAAFIGLHTEAPGLQVATLFEEPMLAALPAAHPLARKRLLSLDDLRAETLFRFERRLNPGFYDHCQACYARSGFSPDTIAEPDDHHILLGLIAEGRGIALIPASLRQVQRQGVVFRRMRKEGTPSSGIAVACRPGPHSAILAAFLELLSADTARPARARPARR